MYLNFKDPLYALSPISAYRSRSAITLSTIPELEEMEDVSPDPAQGQDMSTNQTMRDRFLSPIGLSFALPRGVNQSSNASETTSASNSQANQTMQPNHKAEGKKRVSWSLSRFFSAHPCVRSKGMACEEYIGLLRMHKLEITLENFRAKRQQMPGKDETGEKWGKTKAQKEGKRKRLLKVLRFWT